MKLRILTACVFALSLATAALAQDAGAPPPSGQNGGGQGGGYGRRGGGGGFGGGMGMGRGLMGTVTEVAADHYAIKTDAGDIYTVKFSSNTRMLKQTAGMGMRRQDGEGTGQGEGGGQGRGMHGNPPQEIKATDIKVGDVIGVMGETDAATKTVDAAVVALVDPERVQQMRAMQANFGKTWLAGKVTAIDGTKITLAGAVDNAAHTLVADENTTFRKRRDPVTMADIQVGDMIRAEGAVRDGVFVATTINVGGMMGSETPTVPRNAPSQ